MLLPVAVAVIMIGVLFGVARTESSDLDREVQEFIYRLALRPGMSICEMGPGDGVLLVRLSQAVMPGGKLHATAPNDAELVATAAAVNATGHGGALTTHKATADEWAPGLADHSCDAIYSRMVIHMIDQDTVARYIPQWAASLKAGGRMFMTDHNPLDGTRSGPRRPILKLFGLISFMPVVPEETEVAEIVGGGFALVDGPFDHPYYAAGYGAVYTLPSSLQRAATARRRRL